MPLLHTSSGPIAYDERGAGAPIVLLASGAHDRHDYDELRGRIPAHFRTIALDWPSHGESPPGDHPGTAMCLADIAEETVERLAPEGRSSSAARSAGSQPRAWRSVARSSSGDW